MGKGYQGTCIDICTSGQNGGVGRYTVPPHTTKRRTTTNLKTKNNQNWHIIQLTPRS